MSGCISFLLTGSMPENKSETSAGSQTTPPKVSLIGARQRQSQAFGRYVDFALLTTPLCKPDYHILPFMGQFDFAGTPLQKYRPTMSMSEFAPRLSLSMFALEM